MYVIPDKYLFGIPLILSIAGIGIYLLYRTYSLRRSGKFAVGEVIHVRRTPRGSQVATVEFQAGKVRRATVRVGSWGLSMFGTRYGPVRYKGQSVPILYDPRNPKRAVEYTFDAMWTIPIAVLGISVVAACYLYYI